MPVVIFVAGCIVLAVIRWRPSRHPYSIYRNDDHRHHE